MEIKVILIPYDTSEFSENALEYAVNHPHIEDFNTGTFRQLWDGGYLSNTPLRELLTAHKNYWIEYLRIDQKKKENENCTELIARTPELEVFIVNLGQSQSSSQNSQVVSGEDTEGSGNNLSFQNQENSGNNALAQG